MGAGELEESPPLTPAGTILAAPSRKVRAFFGLPVPEPQRDELGRFIAECSAAEKFRWAPASNLHLTVRFIGGVESELVQRIAGRLDGVGLRGFELELGDIGFFTRGRLVRVVWLGLRTGLDEARALAQQVEAECATAGLAADKRPFRAHLTLARARPRDGAMLPPLPAVPPLAPWRATELILYSSHLSRTGSVYEPLRRVSLQ